MNLGFPKADKMYRFSSAHFTSNLSIISITQTLGLVLEFLFRKLNTNKSWHSNMSLIWTILKYLADELPMMYVEVLAYECFI